jgi:acetyl esterase/lipase
LGRPQRFGCGRQGISQSQIPTEPGLEKESLFLDRKLNQLLLSFFLLSFNYSCTTGIFMQKITLRFILSFLLQLCFIALLGFAVFILFELYNPSNTYFAGKWSSYGPYGIIAVPGMALIVIVVLLVKQSPEIRKRTQKLVIIYGVCGLVVTGGFIPYVIFPYQLQRNARAEFESVWGSNWESRLTPPASGPWMRSSYSWQIQFTGYDYDKSSFIYLDDVEYLRIGNDSFRFNAYIPKGVGPYPVIMNVHGGGWAGGDKDGDIIYRMEYMAAAGYVIFNLNYGAVAEENIGRQYNMSEICANIATFTDFLAANGTSQYKADISRTFMMGLSAGGHLSALMAVGRNNVCNWNPAVRLIGGIHYYPPVDFFHPGTNPGLAYALYIWDVIQANMTEHPEIWEKYNPYSYVKPGSIVGDAVPNLILQGSMDTVVPAVEVRDYAAACDSLGIKSVYLEVPKAEHVFEGRGQFAGGQLTIWAMERFCQLVLADLA